MGSVLLLRGFELVQSEGHWLGLGNSQVPSVCLADQMHRHCQVHLADIFQAAKDIFKLHDLDKAKGRRNTGQRGNSFRRNKVQREVRPPCLVVDVNFFQVVWQPLVHLNDARVM